MQALKSIHSQRLAITFLTEHENRGNTPPSVFNNALANAHILEFMMARAARNRRWADRMMGLIGHAIPRTHVLHPNFALSLLRSDTRWRVHDNTFESSQIPHPYSRHLFK